MECVFSSDSEVFHLSTHSCALRIIGFFCSRETAMRTWDGSFARVLTHQVKLEHCENIPNLRSISFRVDGGVGMRPHRIIIEYQRRWIQFWRYPISRAVKYSKVFYSTNKHKSFHLPWIRFLSTMINFQDSQSALAENKFVLCKKKNIIETLNQVTMRPKFHIFTILIVCHLTLGLWSSCS